MKRFKRNTVIFIILLKVLLAFNVFFLFRLYESIRKQTEEMIVQSLSDANIDEVLNRYKHYPEINVDSAYQGKALSQSRRIEGDTMFVTIRDQNDSILSLRNYQLPGGTTYSDVMVSEIGYGSHQIIDPVFPLRINDIDSLFRVALEKKGISPRFTAVVSVSDSGFVTACAKPIPNKEKLDSVSIYYNPLSGNRYVAYFSSPLAYILGQMAGILISNIALIIVFTLAFRYLYKTVSRLRTIEEMKDDFVNNMTHELKTPIAIAYSANDALLHHNADKDFIKRETYLKIANRQLKRLGALVENILAMSMEKRKSIELNMEPVDLKPFIKEIVSAQLIRKDKDIKIVTFIDEGELITADKTHLANVLNNLIDNAIKYSGKEVNIIIRGDKHQLTVADNGIGIPDKSVPFIFDKFYRVPHGNRHDIRGYGIGLYYVKSILDKMGWSISVTSKEGEGSIFTIKIMENEK